MTDFMGEDRLEIVLVGADGGRVRAKIPIPAANNGDLAGPVGG